jgi:signal peptidase I
VLLVVLLVRSFLVEPFRIPSGSMMPTLLVGDFILVNKFAYGLRLPVLNTKFVRIGEPQRGDVVVFRYPNDPSVDYIKRVIGVPGDHIAYYDRTLTINGKPMPQQGLKVYDGPEAELVPNAEVREEHLQKVSHNILIQPWKPSVEGEFTVPAGQYFVMGDNRDNSNDSRYWGTVPEQNLVGKAFVIWMNWNSSSGGLARERIGMTIQ